MMTNFQRPSVDSIIIEPQSLAAVSRGWQLGDGHFTTIHAYTGCLRHWDYHEARLKDACTRLQMAMPDWAQVKAQALAVIDADADQVLRITLVRGIGGRGYSLQGCGDTQVLFNTAVFPAHYYQWREQGIAIGVCQGRLGSSPLLAGLKTVNRLEQVLLKAELDAQGWHEGLVLDAQHQVVEAVTANVFWREDDAIFTPDLSQLGVWGTMRAWTGEVLGERLRYCSPSLARILAADEVWLSNALLGIVPVTAIQWQQGAAPSAPTAMTTPFKAAASIITRELQQAYEKSI